MKAVYQENTIIDKMDRAMKEARHFQNNIKQFDLTKAEMEAFRNARGIDDEFKDDLFYGGILVVSK